MIQRKQMDIKTIERIKKIKERIWFWEESECSLESVEHSIRYKQIQSRLSDVIGRNVPICLPISYIFLVHKPYTFGHSQLTVVFPCEDTRNESEQFKEAAQIIQKVLPVFKQELSQKTMKRFYELAKLTETEGNYMKTLILRTSADEDIHTEYKVHLVPYFESHADMCKDRFCRIHRVRCKTGGLVGWLGIKETKVDKSKGIANTKLVRLAKLLAGANVEKLAPNKPL